MAIDPRLQSDSHDSKILLWELLPVEVDELLHAELLDRGDFLG